MLVPDTCSLDVLTSLAMCVTQSEQQLLACPVSCLYQSRDSLLVERRQEQQENFLLQGLLSVLTLIQCLLHPVLLQWHVKVSGHSAKSADGTLHLNTHTLLTQQSRSGLAVLSRYSVGT